MKNVLITFVPDYYPSTTGFAQAFVHLHKTILQNKKCDHIYVFSDKEYESPDEENITVISSHNLKMRRIFMSNTPSRALINLYTGKKLKDVFDKIRQIINNENVHMVLIESMFLAWLVPILKKELPADIPVMCRIHGSGPEFTAYYRKKAFEKYKSISSDYLLDCVFAGDHLVVTTKYYFDFFLEHFKDYHRFEDKGLFILANTTDIIPEENDDSDKAFKLVQLGRMDREGYFQKGFQDTIKALMYLEEKVPQIAKEIEYISIGSGKCEEEFLQDSAKLRMVHHVHHSRLQNLEVRQIVQSSNVVLLPSRCEGMSMFAVEAIASGKAMICTIRNGLEAICRDGYNGLTIPEYDYISLTNAIIKMTSDRERTRKMGQNSRKFFDENCSYEVVADQYEVIQRYVNNET